jgi:hypothetical protein
MVVTGFHNFPLSNFKYFLTLFSKFFSSFAHATCSLSVFRQYLALDEVYHPFRVAIPNNSTRWRHIVRGVLWVTDGILTLYDPLFQRSYTQDAHWCYLFRLQFEKPLGLPDFQFELFPLHSPLLGESMFVSFPPLINMLKFSGYSYFIRDLIADSPLFLLINQQILDAERKR